MRVVVALGGNALLRRGQPLTAENQRANVRIACEALAPIARRARARRSHTATAPRSGCSRCRARPTREVETYPLDVLDAQTEGMIGYLIEQELGNLLPFETPLATLLTMIEVDPDDPAFDDPTKSIGPVYDRRGGRPARGRARAGCSSPTATVAARRPVAAAASASSRLRPIEWLLERGMRRHLRRRRRHPDHVPTTRRRGRRSSASRA